MIERRPGVPLNVSDCISPAFDIVFAFDLEYVFDFEFAFAFAVED